LGRTSLFSHAKSTVSIESSLMLQAAPIIVQRILPNR
jgi:hypothetical protein